MPVDMNSPSWNTRNELLKNLFCLYHPALICPLEDVIKFLPTLTGRSFSDIMRSTFSLPTRLGGLGIGDPRLLLHDSQFDSPLKIASALVAQIVQFSL